MGDYILLTKQRSSVLEVLHSAFQCLPVSETEVETPCQDTLFGVGIKYNTIVFLYTVSLKI